MCRDAALLLFLAALATALTFVWPFGGLVMLVFGLPFCALLTRNYGYPAFSLGFLLALYVLSGAPNISLYRGEIEPDYVQLLSFSILALLAGYALGTLPQRRNAPLQPITIPPWLIVLTALPGLLGTGWMLAQIQAIPLFNPAARFVIDPKALLLVESLFVPLILRGVSLMDTPHPPTRLKIELVFLLLLLSLPGYRGWIVEAVGILLLVWLAQDLTRRKIMWAGVGGIVSLAVLVSLTLLRRLTQSEMYDPADSLRVHGAEALPMWFAQLHFSVRQSLFIGQNLWHVWQDGQPSPSLLFTDLLTLLPGQQQAAGAILGDVFGRSLAGGLTASLPAVLCYEYGNWGFLVMAGLGFLMGLGWQRLSRRPNSLKHGLYFLCYFYLLHFFHRGMIKPAYLFIPLMLICCLLLCRKTSTHATSLSHHTRA